MIEGSTFAILFDKALVIIFRSQEATVIGLQLRTSLGSFPALGIIVMQDCLCDGASVPICKP